MIEILKKKLELSHNQYIQTNKPTNTDTRKIKEYNTFSKLITNAKKNQINTQRKSGKKIIGSLDIFLPPLNGERLVIPVISRALNVDVRVNSSLRHKLPFLSTQETILACNSFNFFQKLTVQLEAKVIFQASVQR